jgi:xanthine dehydrogenase accessory factor
MDKKVDTQPEALSIWKAVVELGEINGSGALCTIVASRGSTPRHTGSKMLVYPDRRLLGSVGGGQMEELVIREALEAMRDEKPRLVKYNLSDPGDGDPGVCGGQLEIFVEPIVPKPAVIIVGAGHVGKAVAHLAKWLGFRVAISDDRVELCSPELVPDADEFYPGPLAELPQNLQIDSNTYLILATRSVDIDVPGLPALLETPAAYIGVIGSRRRWETTRKQLIEAGIDEDNLKRVRSPMGLEIAAETPEEIAVSIMAEIIQLRRA